MNTSATLLGFCLVVQTSIRISRFNSSTIIDEAAGIASVLLMGSCILSFLSIKNKKKITAYRLEYIADIFFLLALLCLTAVIALVSFNLFDTNGKP